MTITANNNAKLQHLVQVKLNTNLHKTHDEVRREHQEITRKEVIKDRHELFVKYLPRRFASVNLECFKQDTAEQAKVFRIVKEYANTFGERLKQGTGMIFFGKPGTGKTMLSISLCNELSKK